MTFDKKRVNIHSKGGAMKKKDIFLIISIILIVLIGGISFAMFKINIFSNTPNTTTEESIVDELTIDSKEFDKSVKKDDNSTSNSSTESNEKETETKQVKETKSNKTTQKKTTTNNSKSNVSNEKTSQQKPNNNVTPKEETKELQPWEKLGISKDSYYNDPADPNDFVTYPIEKCKTLKECYETCHREGKKYKPYLEGKESYNCIDVYSKSNRLLGVMFYTKKLKDKKD